VVFDRIEPEVIIFLELRPDWSPVSGFTEVPLVPQIANLQQFAKHPAQFSLQYEHSFVGDLVASSDTVRAVLKFLIPTR
jgi:hypothetical protein